MNNQQQFSAQVAQFEESTTYVEAALGMFDIGSLAVRILPHLRGGSLFAYLFRRFGYPSHAWDDERRLVQYYLTTPLKDVFLLIIPDLSNDVFPGYEPPYDYTQIMFGFCTNEEIERTQAKYERAYGHDAWTQCELYQSCIAAFEATLRDLMRPVFVRDVPVNCYGRVEEKNINMLPKVVDASHMAGYPIPSALFQSTKRYQEFCTALLIVGNGRFEQGIEAMLKFAEERTLPKSNGEGAQ